MPTSKDGKSMNKTGFTLPELLCSLSVIGVLLACAAPINAQLHRHRLHSDATALASALRYARTQAVLSGTGVTVGAAGDNWSNGWQVFADNNRNALMDSTDRLLLTRSLSGSSVIQGNQPVSRYVHFAATGEPVQSGGSFQAGTMTICSPESPDYITIVLGKSGRLRLETTQGQQPCS
jgi:type IV fimbrial biogenesis protein FimT